MIRGRSLLKEPCGQSLCAFCTHRLGAARQSSHVQRRFLQSSRPSSKPPAAGTALREDESTDASFSQQRGPVIGSWARPSNPSGPATGWGIPNLGNGIPPAGPVGNWGRLSGDGIPPAGGHTQADRLNYVPKPMELTPDEQRARDLIVERQRRVVNINAGAGPESTRAGRFLPKGMNYKEKSAVAREALKQRDLAQTKHLQNQEQRQSQGFSVRRIGHRMGDGEDIKKITLDAAQDAGGPHWTGLRRRGTIPVQQEPQSPRDDFAEARSQREKEAKMGRYTPLNKRSIPKSRYSNEGANHFSMSRRPPPGDTNYQRIPERENIARSSLMETYSSDTVTTYSPLAPERTPEARQEEPTYSRQVKPHELAMETEEPAYTRQSKGPTRFASEVSYNEMPKGKGRDKARRRQQFAEDEVDEFDQRVRQKELRKQRKREKAEKKAAAPVPVLLPEYISVSNLAVALRVRFEDFVAKMEELGFEDTAHDHILNSENAGLIAMEYNFDPIIDLGESEDLVARPAAEDKSLLPQRPPVVTIMGHVDHGKTTLLDWLRKSSVAASEHGGITQHIGAFSVPMPGGKIITFLDTPGHAAFLSMRQRGANVTDIVILVVAADDSVKPQTIEAINHAKAAKVPIIVAINKIDKEDSDIERVKQDLARHGVEIEDFGGDTQVVCVSGKTGQGMEELEEAAVTLSEILDMRAEKDGQAEGWILEASIKAMGKVATVLVRRGTMRPGDFIVAGKTWARIRCLRNEAGIMINEAGPGTPVEIDGWKEQPLAGDEVLQAPDEQKAKSVVEYRLEREERDKMAEDMEAINETRKEVEETREREKQEALLAEGEGEETEAVPAPATIARGPKQIYFIVKGDVSGSVEAVIDSVNTVGNGEVQPHILRSGVGQVNEFDIEHAAAAKGHVISFNTLVDENISSLAKAAKVSIIDNNIIYRLIDEVKAKLSEHLTPLITQRVLGEAEIAQVFEITVKGRTTKSIAGCKVRNGIISRNAKVRVSRNGEKVFEGSLASLKNQKKDAMEMRKGTECGMGFENWFDFQVGDQVQSYEEKEEKRSL